MRRILRRTSLVLLVVLPSLFAWGCGPAPRWRKLVGQVERCVVFPDCTEVLVESPFSPAGVKIEVQDAATGSLKRSLHLPPKVSPSAGLARGRLLAWSRIDDAPLVFFEDFGIPPARFPRPKEASEWLQTLVDPTGRWLSSTVRMKCGSSKEKLATLVYDIDAAGPPQVFPDAVGTHLDDGVHLTLREADAAEPFRERPGKVVKWSCVDLQSGKTIWATQLSDEFRQSESVPELHWIVLRSGANRSDGLTGWLVLDDRTGRKVLEKNLQTHCFSANGAFVEVDPTFTTKVHREEQVRQLELDENYLNKQVWFELIRKPRRLLSLHIQGSIVESLPLEYQSRLNSWILRIERTLWDLDTGRKVDSLVQYPHWPSEIAWNGVFSPDGEFEIQKFNFLGVRWIQRVDWPAQRNTPFRIAVAVAPAALLLCLFLRRMLQGRKVISPAKATGEEGR